MLSQREEPTIPQALAEMLLENHTIKSIHLRKNGITNVGAQAPSRRALPLSTDFEFFGAAGVAGDAPRQQGGHEDRSHPKS